MSIIVKNQKILVYNLTEKVVDYCKQMKAYGSRIVAGVNPGEEKHKVAGINTFGDLKEAREFTGVDLAIIFSDPGHVLRDAVETIMAGIKWVVIVTEQVPLQDMVKIISLAEKSGVRVLGAGSAGLIIVGEQKFGVMPDAIFTKGNVAVAGKSDTLSYEVVYQLTRSGIGQSAYIDLGGEAVSGMRFQNVLQLFERDEDTKVIVMVCQIGGISEELAAKYIPVMTKPVVALIAGQTAPAGKKMGHGSAIIAKEEGSFNSKYNALVKAGVHIAKGPEEIPHIVKSLFTQRANRVL
ncbi:MAG: succinate--CoA ligase subunit alpha [bacterium]|nr:succinate--CoA ligase subunit alpha [bacterium]